MSFCFFSTCLSISLHVFTSLLLSSFYLYCCLNISFLLLYFLSILIVAFISLLLSSLYLNWFHNISSLFVVLSLLISFMFVPNLSFSLTWLDVACVANSCETFFFLAIRSTRWSRRRWRREPSRRRRDASPTTVHQTSSRRRESGKEKSSCCVMGNFSFIIWSFFLRRFI